MVQRPGLGGLPALKASGAAKRILRELYTSETTTSTQTPAVDAAPQNPPSGVPAATVRGALETLSAVRSASAELRAALGGAGVPDAQPVRPAEIMRALAERDRRAAQVQHEADQRLAALEHVSAECALLRAQIEALTAENQLLQATAKERLSLLEKNERAHGRYKAALKARLQDITDSIV